MADPKTTVIRPESHEIDTLARRRVPSVLPATWEHRELTGRDYGIDMVVEVFAEGQATGISLMLQIKGTNRDIENRSVVVFDVPVSTLKYSEHFIVPVLLVLCPVNRDEQLFYYLWLQEYIKVVLNFDNSNWRQNTSTVRVHIPVENKMPGQEEHLKFIGNFPRRVNDWVEAGRFHHVLRSFVSDNTDGDWLSDEFVREAFFICDECLSLKALFDDPGWHWGQLIRKKVIEPAKMACEMIMSGEPFSKNQLEMLGRKLTTENSDQDYLKHEIGRTILTMADRLSSFIAIGNDYDHKRFLWTDRGDHDF